MILREGIEKTRCLERENCVPRGNKLYIQERI